MINMRKVYCIIIGIVCLLSCSKNKTLFKKIDASDSGITFNNIIVENDSINPIDLEFLYNGGGVAVGDFNNDGLPDLYFTASTTSNKLYINKGGLTFKDITDESGTTGEHMWSSSAAVVDINNDGLPDIYVCNSIKKDAQMRTNLLYINKGIPPGKDYPIFEESAKEYGLADTSFSVVAAFSDFDNDEDLDMFLVTTKLTERSASNVTVNKDSSRLDVDKLYINEWDSTLNHPVFKEVSRQANINAHGFGLGVAITDVNHDGWKDIYVTNDFFGSDNFYINNKNGTFDDKINSYLKHTAQNAMGVDVDDINNDGWVDILSVDMNPEDNFRKKKNMNSGNYYVHQSMIDEHIAIQYVRNTLQLNMGPRVNANDSLGDLVFGDISFYTGIAETDWSWNPTIADFNNDGNKDVIITNGYPRDVTDHDFVAFRTTASKIAPKETIIEQIPVIKVPNYAFQNFGDLQFENVTDKWGFRQPSFSSGAVAVDLDNDGDLDYVINNINDEALVYENTVNNLKKINKNFLSIDFSGSRQNRSGIGAFAEVYYNGKKQVYENEPCRGYLSYADSKAFFGIDTIAVIDSVVIRWPNHARQLIKNVKANQTLIVDIQNANEKDQWQLQQLSNALFTDLTNTSGINFTHKERDYLDFSKERLLPHRLSQYGPGLAAADVNGDGLDDIYIGGSALQPGSFLMQQQNGKFVAQALLKSSSNTDQDFENLGVLLFDADNDGDNDLWCANGSDEFAAGAANYQDRFYVNDGKGNFTVDTAVLPVNYTSKSCIKAADYDNDGDLDVFVGGRCLPGSYPLPVNSFIYRNDSKPGKIKFTDVTASVCKQLQNIGMVCDAIWTDFDNDNAIDLIVVGEWMPVTFFKNKNGIFEDITSKTGIGNQTGWWNSIAAGDFDNDGDIDYVAGNLGKNAFLRASEKWPVKVFAKDFDSNSNIDAVVTMYMKDQYGRKKEYPMLGRDEIMSQMPVLKKKFLTYKEFAVADIYQVFSSDQLKDALVLQVNNFNSCYIQNNGSGKFELKPLPPMAQLAPINGIVAGDFNNDGNLDIALSGNDYGNEVSSGRYDAMNGLVLSGDGNGNFNAQTIAGSGLFINGDAKALICLTGANNNYFIAASQNRGPVKLFCKHDKNSFVKPKSDDVYALIQLKNGKARKQEFYYGNSFLSQSSRFLNVDGNVKSIQLFNDKGEGRSINL